MPFDVVARYYRYFVLQVLDWTLPVSVLLSTLITFGILSRNNEITAIKANVTSLYRIAMPVVAVAMLSASFPICFWTSFALLQPARGGAGAIDSRAEDGQHLNLPRASGSSAREDTFQLSELRQENRALSEVQCAGVRSETSA